ncbi:hypothetical protein BN2537_10933 [Streptomyces venezuelae]|nr:hypothetical protein BN2537_10933 [Streptomyces venezuelae]
MAFTPSLAYAPPAVGASTSTKAAPAARRAMEQMRIVTSW